MGDNIRLENALYHLGKYYESKPEGSADVAEIYETISEFIESGYVIKGEIVANHSDGSEYGDDTSMIIRFNKSE